MAQIIGLPKLSPTMEEGVLLRWTKKEGDKVSPGDLVAEVETDKANMDFNIEDDGVLLKLLVKEGETVKLGAPVAILGKAGEDVSALVAQAKSAGGGGGAKAAPAPAAAAAPAPAPKQEEPRLRPTTKPPAPEVRAQPQPVQKKPLTPTQTPTPTAKAASTGKLLASPLAKTLAIELGIDLRTVQGSGPGGRIVERDVRAVAEGGGGNGHAPQAVETQEAEPAEQPSQALAVRHARQMTPDAEGDYEDIPASNMRKTIAARLTEAKRDVPHFYLMRTFDAAPLLAF
ncbi:MAG TPA: biotin/lipoyl-containing protein, partial [Kofleriaceae bacterium]|nr:biotin/lipoyl-containing protein [Kofleriaceae bacterium]